MAVYRRKSIFQPLGEGRLDEEFDAIERSLNNIESAQIVNSAITSAKILDGTIVNADVGAAAAIVYSKLNLALGIVNADISASAAIAISKTALGTYIAWAAGDTPTYGGTGGLTYDTVTTTIFRWTQIGKTVHFVLLATGTTGSAISARAITFTLPVTASGSATAVFTVIHSTNNGSSNLVGSANLASTTICNVFAGLDDSTANWGDGTGRKVWVSGTYEAA